MAKQNGHLTKTTKLLTFGQLFVSSNARTSIFDEPLEIVISEEIRLLQRVWLLRFTCRIVVSLTEMH